MITSPRSCARALLAAALLLAAACATAPLHTEPPPSATPADPAAAPAVPREFRGAWIASVSNIDWPSRRDLTAFQQQAELIAMLDRALALNLNAVVLQIRPAADALYDSPHEPWSEYLTGLQGRPPEPYYDPLTFAVEQAHARGLELHVWFNPYRARHPSARGPQARTHLSATRPDLVKTYGRHLWMDPGEPEVMEQTLAVVLDVVQRYDVDGIHVDDYFYPYPELGPDSVAIPFPDSASYARYQAAGGTLARDDWRRRNVDTLMFEMHRRTKAAKPWVKVGISPFGIWRPGHPAGVTGFDAYARLYADARRWLREGWVDYFVPQLYQPIAHPGAPYPVMLDWWMGENVHERHMWPGLFTSRAATTWEPDELLQQIRIARERGADGAIHFSMRALMPRRDTIPPPPPTSAATSAATSVTPEVPLPPLAERLHAQLYAMPALVPASPWLARGAPGTPAASLVQDAATGELALLLEPGNGNPVRWWTVRVHADGVWRHHILPAHQSRLVVAPSLAARPAAIVVTAVDRYGTESAAHTVR